MENLVKITRFSVVIVYGPNEMGVASAISVVRLIFVVGFPRLYLKSSIFTSFTRIQTLFIAMLAGVTLVFLGKYELKILPVKQAQA